MFGLPLRSIKFQLDTLNICQGKMHTIEDAEVWHAIGDTISHLRVIDCLDASISSQSNEDEERTRTAQGRSSFLRLSSAVSSLHPRYGRFIRSWRGFGKEESWVFFKWPCQ